MKRIALAACILLSGCYIDPNTGRVYPAQQYPQRQVLVYHYQVPPPNRYYQANHQDWRQQPPQYQGEWRQPEAMPPASPRLDQYYACAESNQERQFQQPQNCGAYLQ
jgi:hypothetical protein